MARREGRCTAESRPTLRTERLELRPFQPADAEALHALFIDPDVRHWLLDDEVVPPDWVDEEIAQSEARFAAGGCGLWTVREHHADAVIGFVGFRPFWSPPELELVYGLLPTHWGRGLATEAAHAAARYAFGALGLDEIRAATDVPNTASIAVLHRLGFEERERTADEVQGTARFRLGGGVWREPDH